MRSSQEEPFVGRCGEVGDDLGSAVVAARQVRDLMKLCLLMNRVYPPYSKWLGTAFAALPCAQALTPHLSGALAARSWQEREQHLSPAYEIAAGVHNDLDLTEPLEVTVRYSTTGRSGFWTRTGSPTPLSRRSVTRPSGCCRGSVRSTSTSTTPM